ncbi:MAG: glycosyltransferase family 4 protein [Pseudomonadota bacterium]
MNQKTSLKTHILFLTYRMQMGFGVDVVVSNLYQHLTSLGAKVTIGCMEQDDTYKNINIVQINADKDEILALSQQLGITAIIAHTSPYFEQLAEIDGIIPCWAYEHGDPTPELFSEADMPIRKSIKENKQNNCYHKIQGIIAISEFIKYDIADNLPANRVHIIYNGADNLPDYGSKTIEQFSSYTNKPLKIGALMRMGTGEAFYKGNNLLMQLFHRLKNSGIPVEFHIMGRGSKEDAQAFNKLGIITHLNASDDEKIEYLRNLDLFCSLSLWEGFNLPMIEAQSLGTLSMALDTGAHPEITPYVMSNLNDMVHFINACQHNKELLFQGSKTCYHFVHNHFNWKQSAYSLLSLIEASNKTGLLDKFIVGKLQQPYTNNQGLYDRVTNKVKTIMYKLKFHIKHYGLYYTIKKIIKLT